MVTRILPALLLSIAVAAGCESTTEPSAEAFGLTLIEPWPRWESVYHEIEECVGVEGAFERVNWYSAEGITLRNAEGGLRAEGIWLVAQGDPHGIALTVDLLERAARPTWPGQEKGVPVVAHEAIHEVLQLASHGGQVWCECDPNPSWWPQCR